MKRDTNRKPLCVMLGCALAMSVLTSCGSSKNDSSVSTVQETDTPSATEDATNLNATPAEGKDSTVTAEVASTSSQRSLPAMSITPEQQNSINMLNYLTVLVQEIQESKNSRLYLETAYSELINNTEPSIVDDLTLDEYEKILSIIENYRMTVVQRERLQYIYEQNRASAIRSAMPNPLAILGVAQSGNPLKAIASLAYAAVDSVNSYNSYTQQLDLQYLQDGWALDDAEAANLHDSRTSMFTYMVRVSRDLPAGITLSEEAVNDFVEWENKDNVTSRIRWLESNQETYRFFGEYWLVLADSYFENEDYEKCLEATAAYEALDNSIFRRDIRFAQTLPYAIAAARENLASEAYIETAEHYAQLIVKNTNNSNWSLRYFAAQTYVDLFVLTADRTYLQRSYDLTYDSVNELVPKQYELNSTYLAEVEETTADKDADKDEKETIKAYNKLLEETRKTELPPVYEPLRLNCELLSALADQLDISQAQREDIDKILHPDGERLFLNVLLDEMSYFSTNPELNVNDVLVEYADGKLSDPEINISAQYVLNGDSVTLTVDGESEAQTYSDWSLEAVNRHKSDDPQNFTATFTSSNAKHVSFADGDVLTISLTPPAGQDDVQVISVQFKVHKKSGFLGIPSMELERIDI